MAVSTPAAGPAGPDQTKIGTHNPYSALPNWLYPTFVAATLTIFGLYAMYTVFFEHEGRFGPYLSPFYSPEIRLSLGGFPIPPAIWVAWAPLAFRATCYYYRKAYFRSFFWHPRSCAVPEHNDSKKYKGETGLFVFNNFHRFAFYATVVQVAFLWFDAIVAFAYQGEFHLGLGNALLLINVICLSGYTFGCHAFRHLAGGSSDCFSCTRTRFKLWKGITILNIRHDRWAWVSLFTVWATDIYLRLLIHGGIPHGAWN